MAFVRLRDLGIQLQPDGVFLLRAPTRGVGARVPAPALDLLAFCSTPRERDEVAQRYGPQGLRMFDALIDAGFIADQATANETAVFFENFAALDVHRRMLDDKSRVNSYKLAIESLIKPGMVVLDAGTGTGVLACLAGLSGAARVYAVDNSDALDLAAEVIRASGLDQVVMSVRGNFAQVELPEPVDVIVTETFGALGLAEGGLRDVAAVARRFLKPEGQVIPHQVSLWIAPVTDEALVHEALGAFSDLGGVRLDALRPSAMNRGITLDVKPHHIGAAACFDTLAMRDNEGSASGMVTLAMPQDDPCFGFCAWFDLHLAPGLVLSTSPQAPTTHWYQVYLPLEPFTGNGPLKVHIDVQPASEDPRGLQVTIQFGETTVTHRVR